MTLIDEEIAEVGLFSSSCCAPPEAWAIRHTYPVCVVIGGDIWVIPILRDHKQLTSVVIPN